MRDSKLAMGTNILKVPGGIFMNVRLGNLLSYESVFGAHCVFPSHISMRYLGVFLSLYFAHHKAVFVELNILIACRFFSSLGSFRNWVSGI